MEPRPDPPTAADVVQMAKDKMPAADIIRRMRDADAVYALTASQLARLREQGVPDEVIDYMQRTHLAAVRREAMDQSFLYDPWPYSMGFGSPWGGPFGYPWRGRRGW